MGDFSKYTPTELNNFINDLSKKYETIKEEIYLKLDTIKKEENLINELIEKLNKIEKLHLDASKSYLEYNEQ